MLLVPLLAACVPPQGSSGGNQNQSRNLLAHRVSIAVPAGYCIEPASVLEREDTALLLAGRCAGAEERVPAVLTASIGTAGSAQGLDIAGNGADLAAFFRSERGRAALSRRGRAVDVRVEEALGIEGAFLMRLADFGATRAGPVAVESWRAVLPLDGRLVSLTVTGKAGGPVLGRDAGKALIADFVAATQRANR
jgi:hypothetical protein